MEQIYYFVELSCWLWLGRKVVEMGDMDMVCRLSCWLWLDRKMVEMVDMDMVCRLGFAKHCVTS